VKVVGDTWELAAVELVLVVFVVVVVVVVEGQLKVEWKPMIAYK